MVARTRISLAALSCCALASAFVPPALLHKAACYTSATGPLGLPGTPAAIGASRARLFSSASVLEGPAQSEDEAGKKPSRSPKIVGPWVILEGLPYKTKEADVRAFLGAFDVKSIDMPLATPQGSHPGESKGIAHVEVGSDEEAGRVLSLNGKELLGRWISVERCYSPRDVTTIKVRGVQFQTTTEELEKYFSQYGEVQASVIKQDKYGIAYVIFKDNAGAVAALAADGQQMGRRWLEVHLYCKPFKPIRADKARSGPRPPVFKARLTGLPYESTVDDVKKVLEDAGIAPVQLSLPAFRGDTSRNIGLAFFSVATQEELDKALEIRQLTIGERFCVISKPERQPRREGEGGGEGVFKQSERGAYKAPQRWPRGPDSPWKNRVYLGGLPFGMEAADITAYFEGKGVTGVERVALPKNKVGVAYVSFATPEMAAKAAALSGEPIEKAGRTRALRANLMEEGPATERKEE